MANRSISEFSSILAPDIDEQDLLTLVHVFEADPVLRNKKITFTEFKDYLDLYYPSTSGATFGGNVRVNGNFTVTGTSTLESVSTTNLGTFSGIVVQNNATVSGTVSGNTVTGNNVQRRNWNIFNCSNRNHCCFYDRCFCFPNRNYNPRHKRNLYKRYFY